MELVCCVQKYEWGKRGKSSTVAQLARINRDEEIEDLPYAELWMGAHPSGPSKLKESGVLLRDHLSRNPDQLGASVLKEFGETLPFLFKVLSVEKALSIQAHPTKLHAQELFEKFPDIYKDPNHKPEIAIALTNFEALCGFRPRQEIAKSLSTVEELKNLIGNEQVENYVNGTEGIRSCFEKLMTCKADDVKCAIDKFLAKKSDCAERQLAERLNRQFPGDVGVLCVFWLNYVTLNPGEALYLAPNEPHAYISGDCIECMANSDNVVRAGLTPKLRDVSTLCKMLTYKSYQTNEIRFQPVVEDKNSDLFKPPLKDFAVARIRVLSGTEYRVQPRSSASIIITIAGESEASSSLGVTSIKPGVILFLPAMERLTLKATSELVIFQAFCNV